MLFRFVNVTVLYTVRQNDVIFRPIIHFTKCLPILTYGLECVLCLKEYCSLLILQLIVS